MQVKDCVLYCNVTSELYCRSVYCGLYFSKLIVTSFYTIATAQLYCYVPAAGLTGGDQNYKAEKLHVVMFLMLPPTEAVSYS